MSLLLPSPCATAPDKRCASVRWLCNDVTAIQNLMYSIDDIDSNMELENIASMGYGAGYLEVGYQ